MSAADSVSGKSETPADFTLAHHLHEYDPASVRRAIKEMADSKPHRAGALPQMVVSAGETGATMTTAASRMAATDDVTAILAQAGSGGFVLADPVVMANMTSDQIQHTLGQRLQTIASFIPGYSLIKGVVGETQQTLASPTKPSTTADRQADAEAILAQAGNGGFVSADPVLMRHMTPDQIRDLVKTRLSEAADFATVIGAMAGTGAAVKLERGAADLLARAATGAAEAAGELVPNGAFATDEEFSAELARQAQAAGYKSSDVYGITHLKNPAEIVRFAQVYAKHCPDVAIENMKFAAGRWDAVEPGTQAAWQAAIEKVEIAAGRDVVPNGAKLTDAEFSTELARQAQAAGYAAPDLFAIYNLKNPVEIERFARIYAKDYPRVALRNMRDFGVGQGRVLWGTEPAWQAAIERLELAQPVP